jgi:aminoglycoside phosphotransferase (APT) family kinase protein
VPAIAEIVTDPAILGAPFFVMEEIAGCEASPHALKAEPYAPHRTVLGQQKWTLLGTLAGYELTAAELAEFPETSAEAAWQVELDKWTAVWRRHANEPEPLVERALRWLRDNPPPPEQKLCFVHGDYRTGNFLYDRDGQLRAILDWEMAHAGDPHEDIAWAILPSWGWPDADRPGLLIPKDDAFRIWEQASALRIDPRALHWWSLFSTVKGVGLWAACAHNVMRHGSLNAIEFAACWFPRDLHLRLMAELLFHKVA